MKHVIASVLVALCVAGCAGTGASPSAASATKVSTQASPSAPFNTYRTWNWVTASGPLNADPVIVASVRRSIEERMIARGYAKSDNPDVAIAFTLGSRDSVEVNDYGPYRPYYPAYGRRRLNAGWYPVYRDIEIEEVTEGSLAIDIYDAKTREPVWHGHGSRDIPRSGVTDSLINSVVGEILSTLPIPAQ